MRIIVKNLACRRAERLLFSGIDLKLETGQALIITGGNGAGKSSLLDLLSGQLKPFSGSIHLEGADSKSMPEVINMIGHRDGLKSMLTAGENLDFAREMLGSPALKPADALAKLDIAHLLHLPVAYLSAGQRRRVALARLFVSSRPIWMLDEPTSALDGASQVLLGTLMREHLAQGGMLIAATHIPLGLDNALTLHIQRNTPAQDQIIEECEVFW